MRDTRGRFRSRLTRIEKTKKFNTVMGVVTLLVLAGLILYATFRSPKILDPKGSPKTLGNKIELKVEEVKADEPITWNDAIRQVFPADEAGRMIRICMKENGTQVSNRTNWNKNGTYDHSWCQVNSCHKPKDMTDEEWLKNLEDPVFHAQQVRKIYLSQGWNAWSVYKFGLVK